MTNVKALHEVEALEERLQAVKWRLIQSPMQTEKLIEKRVHIVSRTAGLLRHPSHSKSSFRTPRQTAS